MTTLYDELSIKPTATTAEIRRAYRHRAMKTHPDRDGGNAEEFKRVQLAYEVLSDPMRRAEYDRTGKTNQNQQSLREKAIPEFQALFAQMMQQPNFRYANLINLMRGHIKTKIGEIRHQEKLMKNQIDKNNDIASRITVKSGENLFAGMLEANNKQIQEQLKMMNNAIQLFEFMVSMLDDYEYQVDHPETTITINPFAAFTTGTTTGF